MQGIHEVMEYEQTRNEEDGTDGADAKLTLGLLEAKTRQVRALRAEVEVHDKEYAIKHAEFNQANALLIEKWQKAKADLADAEARLRELTLEAYHMTCSKKPARGVGIKLVKRCEYNETIAFEFAIKNGIALKLDKTAFEKTAKANIGNPLFSFVKIIEEPQATIAKEL